ncbi:MAG: hypothetical protein WAR37_03000 [Candidatus Microsaccharimonas sp.]
MRKLVIAVDCDDVLVNTTPFLVNAYNKLYGTNATLAQSYDPAYEIWQADEDLQVERFGLLTESKAYKELGPDPVESRVLHDLAKLHELHLVTARKEHERDFTQLMLNRELAGVFTSMEFIGWGGSKGEVCKRIDADILIDDNSAHLYNALQHGLPKGGAILFGDYPWNIEERTNEEFIFCKDWVAVKKVIDSIASRENGYYA